MKLIDSGEAWLGEVPAEWKRSRIKNVATFSPTFSSEPPALSTPCTIVPMEALSEYGVIDVGNQERLKDIQSGLTLFEEGDVLFAKITPCMENGKGALVSGLPTKYAFGSTEFHVLRPGPFVDGRFLYYYTYNPVFRDYAAENMTGAAGQKRVSSRFLKDTRLFLPPLPEQRVIAKFLDISCSRIDRVCLFNGNTNRDSRAILNQQIETLFAYRQSLIHECVTGKRRISDEDISRAKANA